MTLFSSPCKFIAGAASIASLPKMTHPEIAFIGRSNCGKSSLINALVGQKSLVRTSQNPGATRQINFFLLADKLMLADMPGYGFAKVSKKQKAEWNKLITHYLVGRQSLQRTCLLIDARRGVMESDEEMMALLDEMAVSYQIVLTKADTLKPPALQRVLQSTQDQLQSHVAAYPEVFVTSSKNEDGIKALQQSLAAFA